MASKTPEGRVRVEPTITLGPVNESQQIRADNNSDTVLKSSEHRAPTNQSQKPLQGHIARKSQHQAPPPVIKRGIHGGLFASIIIILLSVIAVGAWYFYQQIMVLQSDLLSSRDALMVSTSQIGDLESRLSDTDQVMNKSEDKTSQTLKFLDSEMRKLWAVANQRNKQSIKDNQDAIDSLKQSLKKAKEEADLAKKQLADTRTVIDAQSKTLQALGANIKELQGQLGMQDVKLINVQESISKISQQSNVVDRIKSIEQALQSIDAYRRQTNSSVEQINRDIRILYQRTTPATTNQQ